MAWRTLSRLASKALRSGEPGAAGPEQSLEFRQHEVPQLAPGDDLRHRVTPVCREAPTIRAFPAARGVIIGQGKACRRQR